MYGSDWHMIHTLKKHADYLEQWQTLLAPPQWNEFRDDFFSRNAIRWLDLPSHIQRQTAAGRPIPQHVQDRWTALGT